MQDPHFFGYGSLVNRATHVYAPARPARLRDWARTWLTLPDRPIANLTAIPRPGTEIEGLIAPVPGDDWRALDRREAGYARRPALDVAQDLDPAPIIAVYAIPPENAAEPGPILLSYLDVVVQGYLREFGAVGVTRFFETTSGWAHPVADDRATPLYPRAQRLSSDETALVDHWIAELGLSRTAPPSRFEAGPLGRLRRRLLR